VICVTGAAPDSRPISSISIFSDFFTGTAEWQCSLGSQINPMIQQCAGMSTLPGLSLPEVPKTHKNSHLKIKPLPLPDTSTPHPL
jgi:hypothetical protein